MTLPLRITFAGNTYNPCLVILQRKGYELSSKALDDGSVMFCAEKDGTRVSGHTPPELLGLVVLGEEFGTSWRQPLPDVLTRVLEDKAK